MIVLPSEKNNGHLCPRCNSNSVFFRVQSEILDLKVCVECGLEAAKLGLIVTELSKERAGFSRSDLVEESEHPSL